MIRTCTDAPAGILADTSAIAIAVARIIRNDIASFCPKYPVIAHPNFWRFWTFSTLMLDGDFQHRHVSEGHVQERHTKPLLALRWSDEPAHGNVCSELHKPGRRPILCRSTFSPVRSHWRWFL